MLLLDHTILEKKLTLRYFSLKIIENPRNQWCQKREEKRMENDLSQPTHSSILH